MPETSKRLEFLQKLTSKSDDPFAWYGLAMEYRSLERFDDAVATFTSLRAKSPDYVPMYLMCGQTLEKAGRAAEAREWLTAGVAAAGAKGDTHAASGVGGGAGGRRAGRSAEGLAYDVGRPARALSRRALTPASSPRSLGS